MAGRMRASRDALTGLAGRQAFFAQVRKALKHGYEESVSGVYLRLLNLEAYAVRNGADAGDEVVKAVATQLTDALSKKYVGRFESGSFMAFAVTDAVEPLVSAINRTLPGNGETDGLVLKAGYCELYEGLDLAEAGERAHYAFDAIRFDVSANSRLFDQGLHTAYRRRRYVVEHLDDAIARGEIRAYAQSIVRVLTGMICEVEILARWQSEEFGFLRPDEFIPELEKSQLIHKLDAEVVRLACKQWHEASQAGINVPFGINLSRLDFELTDMYAVVREAMAAYDVPVEQVHIEVTESALSHDNKRLAEGIDRFRRAGFTLYLDDFGSGYSSLQVLEGRSFDVVKLDMSLLCEVETNERARVIVADAVSMAKRLGLQTLCEGVETEDQFLFLKAVGCEKAQGYLFAKPLSHEEIMTHLQETADKHESPEVQRYFDALGKVNLIDGTRSTVHGVEAAHFLGTQPFAIVEVRGESVSFLTANAAFQRFVARSESSTVEDFAARLSTDLADIRNKVLYAASKARSTDTAQHFDFLLEGMFCTFGVTHLESMAGRDAYLVEVLSVTRYSQYNDFRLLERSLSFLYTIFKRIDLLDTTDNSWRNLYLNVPRYNALRAAGTPVDEIEAFAEAFIHPDDRARFLTFYDLSTVEERLKKVPTVHLAETFFALSDENRYEDQLFMIIPVSLDGHRQFLSCMRDLDVAGLSRQNIGGYDRISDAVLLSGILDVTDRNIFWKDEQRRFVGANQRFLDFYGFSGVEDILGKTSDDLGWTRNDHFKHDEERVLAGEQVVGVAGVVPDAQGELHAIRISKMPLWREGKVLGLVGFFKDEGPCRG